MKKIFITSLLLVSMMLPVGASAYSQGWNVDGQGKWIYCDTQGNQLTNCTIQDGDKFYGLDSNGVWIEKPEGINEYVATKIVTILWDTKENQIKMIGQGIQPFTSTGYDEKKNQYLRDYCKQAIVDVTAYGFIDNKEFMGNWKPNENNYTCTVDNNGITRLVVNK